MRPIKNIRDVIISNPIGGTVSTRREEVLMPEVIKEEFSPSEQKIVLLDTEREDNKKVLSMTRDELKSLAGHIRQRSVFMLGLNVTNDPDGVAQEMIIIQGIMALLYDKKGNQTRGTILAAIEEGLLGRYLKKSGDFVHFSPSNIIMWIDEYENNISSIRKRVAQEIDLQKERTKPGPPSADDSRKELIGIINKHVFNRINMPDHREPGVSDLYDSMVEYKIYVPDTEEKKQAWERISHYNKKSDEKEKTRLAKNLIYNDFIQSLADFQVILDNNGNQIAL